MARGGSPLRILYLLREHPDKTMLEIIEAHKSSNEVSVVDLREEKDFSMIFDLIEKCDKVISC